MGKASSSKKVARAAGTGGGRTARGTAPWGWYSVLALFVLVGSALVFVSRGERIDKLNPKGGVRPRVGDHWHAALGVYLCDRFAPNVPDSGQDPHGIHTHGDGVVHIHPFDRTSSGNNAELRVFDTTVGMTLSATKVKLPNDSKTYTDGVTKCGGKTGSLSLFVNGRQVAGDPADYRPKDRDLLILAFTAKGKEFPKRPPTAAELDHLSDVGASTTPTTGATTPLPAGTATTPATTPTTSTTAPPASTTSSSAP